MDCEWNEWQNGTCSNTCGNGTMTNNRTKKVEAAHGGQECPGSSNVTEGCNIEECPGNMYLHKNCINLVMLKVLNCIMH